jgi:hypothetical protein
MKQEITPPFSIGRMISAVAMFIIALAAISFTVSEFLKKGGHFVVSSRGDAIGDRGQPLFYRSIGQTRQDAQTGARSGKSALLAKSYTLEIDNSPSIASAEEFLRKLSKLRVEAYYTPVQRDGRVIYRIRTGIYQSKIMADQASAKLLKDQNINTKVTKLQ